jgi:HSP20 family protein
MTLQMRNPTTQESTYPFPRYFGSPDWHPHWEPLRWLADLRDAAEIPVEEYVEAGHLVVRAEVPGVDPDTDVMLELDGDRLRIRVDRRPPDKTDDRHVYRSEIRYGTFRRTLSLPVDVKPDEVQASYRDGTLTIRWPLADEQASSARIQVHRGHPAEPS